MNNPPYRNFGFEYAFEGATYSHVIIAETREEAERKLEAMKHSSFVGELHPVESQNPLDAA